MRRMKFEADAILFDIDGTLVDSTPAVIRTWTAFAEQRSLDSEEILRVSHGRRTEDTLADLLPMSESPLPQSSWRSWNSQISMTSLHCPGRCRVEESCRRAVGGGDIRLAATNESPTSSSWPPHTPGAYRSRERRARQARPGRYLAAAAALGADPARCLIIEDAPAGIRAGRSAGAAVLAVATSHDKDDLQGADAVVTDMTAISMATTGTGSVIITVH